MFEKSHMAQCCRSYAMIPYICGKHSFPMTHEMWRGGQPVLNKTTAPGREDTTCNGSLTGRKKLWTQNTVEIYRICCFRRVGLCLSVIMEQHFDIVCIWQNRRKGETKPVSRFLPRTPHPLEHVSGIWFVRLLSPRTCVPCNSMRSMDRLAITSQEDQATAV
jgi:hypothetical protein